MKNLTKKPKFTVFFRFTALMAVFAIAFTALSLTGCPDPNNGSTDPCDNGHAWGEYTQTTPPTCEDAGIKTRACTRSDCNVIDTVTEIGDSALGHDWEITDTDLEPTCEEDGHGSGYCKREGCDATIQNDVIHALGHEEADTPHEVVVPTCTENGYKIFRCIRFDECDYTFPAETEGENLGGHLFTGSWQNSPTQHWKVCEREGCTAESGNGTTESDRANHTSSGTANCTTPETCTVCNYEIAPINPTAHAWNETPSSWTTVLAPTCSETGTAQASCLHNAEHKDNTLRILAINPDNHDMDWIETTVSYISQGIETHTCVDCDYTDGQIRPSPQTPITSREHFAEVMADLPNNALTDPYTILLNIDELGGHPYTSGSVGNTLGINSAKFVNLDMSGSTFTSVENSAFGYVVMGSSYRIIQNLVNIILPDSVTSIGNEAFRQCTRLASITLSNNPNLTIGADAFQDSGLTSITLPDGITSIWLRAFRNSRLTGIIIPDSVTSIEASAFQNCTNLVSVTLPNNPNFNSIGSSAFQGTGLTSITIPDSVTTIENSAFRNCTDLESVKLPNNVNFTLIDNAVFRGCTSLTEILIPNSVTTIGTNLTATIQGGAFQGCTSLIGSFNETWNQILLAIPDSVTTISHNAFSDCTDLLVVIIGDGVTSIGNNAFQNCTSLETAIIGISVNNIGQNAFDGASFSGGLMFMSDTTTFNNNSFPYGESLNIAYTAGGSGVYILDDITSTWKMADD